MVSLAFSKCMLCVCFYVFHVIARLDLPDPGAADGGGKNYAKCCHASDFTCFALDSHSIGVVLHEYYCYKSCLL